MPEPVDRRPFWAVVRQPRMIGLLLLFLAAAMVCARLGVWQLDRAQQRAELAAQQEAAEEEAAGPEGLGVLLPPQSTFPGELVGRQAWVEGEYDADGQLLVADRVLDGEVGYLVLTPLRVSDDGTGGSSWADLSGSPVLPVVRGWVASPDDARALAPPEGTVRLTGYLQASEAAGEADLPTGQTDAVATGELVNLWGGPSYSGYLVLISSDPEQVPVSDGGPAALPRPTIEGGTGLNLQNLFYALQWWVFGGFAVLLWLRLVRDEASGRKGIVDLDDLAAEALADEERRPAADRRP
ncbi:SURF1 family protein [Cellulosimicrobium marinum]|uniref:SURF1 family protein n=1 Tax=Cellulosimicrobium marinum TaxID=1638992 RepID=UPI001E60AE32|nr:SURF1 family protein [Cellulosimicrobium marinum]MCB7136706.1 SURF1 family protein [Cellulosimicrobium marinum]